MALHNWADVLFPFCWRAFAQGLAEINWAYCLLDEVFSALITQARLSKISTVWKPCEYSLDWWMYSVSVQSLLRKRIQASRNDSKRVSMMYATSRLTQETGEHYPEYHPNANMVYPWTDLRPRSSHVSINLNEARRLTRGQRCAGKHHRTCVLLGREGMRIPMVPSSP